MKNISLKRGILLSLVVSFLATSPRIMRPGAEHVSYIFMHLIYLWLLSFVFWMLSRYAINGNRRILKVTVLLIASGFISYFYHKIAAYFFVSFSHIYADFPFMDQLPLRKKQIALFARGIALSGVILFVEYYFKILFEKQRASIEIEQLRKEKLEAQLDSLRQQISPHFLFNSLSTLQSMVPDAAVRKYILQLSQVYRYLLAFNENHLATLREELEFIEAYLYILKERFEDGLQVEISIDENLMDKKLPPLVLQLLVENAIKHNVVSLEEPLRISIISSGENLSVSNKIKPRISAEPGTGKGLQNISTRYQLLSDKEINILDGPTDFTVNIPLL
ncbi:sensor histidine kinase [Flavobacterium silvaticum]|uniref:Signal transduction histidine kinase internal region domain-containing protein n=1 Tax=Flavobacterium silvaticum TaxID=1852020 RepID=A0A972FSR7_9FLAO|nr:histidine kinase [Flavobacterium silvaticum]NMH27803.1 hypothetical protein [Flavobacterium silvaticum]